MHEAGKFDDVLKELGGFGRFQKNAIASLSFSQFFLAFSNFGFVFFGYIPDKFHCHSTNQSNVSGCEVNCTAYVSDDGYQSYAVEWGLVCKNTHLLRFAQTMHMAGLLLGAIVCGKLADTYGRLCILYISLIFLTLFSFITVFVQDIYTFCVVTFVLGVFCQGCGLTSYTIILESVGPNHRALCGILEQIFYAFGIATVALLAYDLPNWRHLAAVLTIFGPISLLLMLPFHVESTRWLFTRPGRRTEAIRNLRFIAKTNGVYVQSLASQRVPTPLLDALLTENEIPSSTVSQSSDLQTETYSSDRAVLDENVNEYCVPLMENRRNTSSKFLSTQVVAPKDSILVMATHNSLRKWTTIFSLCWFSNSAAYYGSTIAAGEAFQNRFLSFALSGLIEIPGHCLSPVMMNSFGRRLVHSNLQIVGGVLFSLVAVFQNFAFSISDVVIWITYTLAKVCISMSFASAYVYASEIYPTSIVNFAIGVCVTSGRLGGTVSPVILSLGRGSSCFFFGIMAFVCGLLALFLPETLGQRIAAVSSQIS